MSQISKGIAGALAVSLAFGAVAWGHELAGVAKDPSPAVAGINRAAKADRMVDRTGSGTAVEPTRTISLRLDSLSDTSVLIRMPVAREARNMAPAPSVMKAGDRKKAAVACEPPVSVLTEVAKLLQPGRCVT